MAVTSLNSATNLRGEVLDELYRRHWAELCRYIKRTFGGGPPEPEDVAQQSFMSYACLKEPAGIENP